MESSRLFSNLVDTNLSVPSIICCPVCQETFLDNGSFKAHMSQYHGNEMPFTCTLCGKGYASFSGLSLHLQVHEGKSFLCPVCDSKFTQNSTMKRHLRMVHKTTQCLTCRNIFKLDSQEFQQHVLTCGR